MFGSMTTPVVGYANPDDCVFLCRPCGEAAEEKGELNVHGADWVTLFEWDENALPLDEQDVCERCGARLGE